MILPSKLLSCKFQTKWTEWLHTEKFEPFVLHCLCTERRKILFWQYVVNRWTHPNVCSVWSGLVEEFLFDPVVQRLSWSTYQQHLEVEFDDGSNYWRFRVANIDTIVTKMIMIWWSSDDYNDNQNNESIIFAGETNCIFCDIDIRASIDSLIYLFVDLSMSLFVQR